jgi:hypothetical protein
MRRITFLKDATIKGTLNLELVQDGVIPERTVKVAFKKNKTYDMYEWAQDGDVTSLTTDDPALMGEDAQPGDTLTFAAVPLSWIEGQPAWTLPEEPTKAIPKSTVKSSRSAFNPLLDDPLDHEENDAVLC